MQQKHYNNTNRDVVFQPVYKLAYCSLVFSYCDELTKHATILNLKVGRLLKNTLYIKF